MHVGMAGKSAQSGDFRSDRAPCTRQGLPWYCSGRFSDRL